VEQVIRAFLASWTSRDRAALGSLFAPDAVLEQPAYALDGGERRGRDALRGAMVSLLDQFEYDSIDIHEITEGASGTLVALTTHGRGRASGVPIEQQLVHVYEFRDGLITRLAWYFDRAEGAARAGL
jgi:ketosteroid isomerase-like protein